MIKKISRKAPLFMAACLAFALVLAGCDNSSSPTRIYHTVTFHVHGGSTVQAQSVRDGETAERPAANPTRSGFTFTNWFTAQTGGSAFDFATPITGDTVIHAQWQPAGGGNLPPDHCGCSGAGCIADPNRCIGFCANDATDTYCNDPYCLCPALWPW